MRHTSPRDALVVDASQVAVRKTADPQGQLDPSNAAGVSMVVADAALLEVVRV